MKAKKLTRFAAIKTFQNVFEFPENIQDKWHEIFKNEHPILLELACGKGDYAVNMAIAFPNKNFVGVDVKGNRMFVGAQRALQEKIENVRFLRVKIENIISYFPPKSIDEIWITFPDPFLKDGKAKNRLTHHKFLAMYQQILKPNGMIHLKTDSTELYEFTLEMIEHHQCKIIENVPNVYEKGEPAFPLNIKTFYEGMHLADNRIIKYVRFILPEKTIEVPPKKQKNEEAII